MNTVPQRKKPYRILLDPVEGQLWARYTRKGSKWKEIELVDKVAYLSFLFVDKGRDALRRVAMSTFSGYTEMVMP